MAQILIEVLATFILVIIIGCLCIAATAAEEVMVSMRDVVTIKTYVETPSGKGLWPAVLVKGYGITTDGADSFVNAGYAYVAQDVRGESDPHRISGTPRFFADDVDGYDTIEWVARQPWCDGNVAMVGVSYYGATQWLAAANGDPEPPPNLKAIIPSGINPDSWERCYRAHGAMNLSMVTMSRVFNKDDLDRYPGGADAAFMYLPLLDMDRAIRGSENTIWNEYVSHCTYDDYWAYIGCEIWDTPRRFGSGSTIPGTRGWDFRSLSAGWTG